MRLASLLLTTAFGLLAPEESRAAKILNGAAEATSEVTFGTCPKDTRTCPDEKIIRRDWRNKCRFPKCPEILFCPQDDTKTCPDGRVLERDPKMQCNFPACEPMCCDPSIMPRSRKDAQCCGATGKWVESRVDGTFECNGVTSKGPDFPSPFGKPCEVECKNLRRRQQCRENDANGCRWLGRRQCIHEKDITCENLPSRFICKKSKKCKWMKDKCFPRCPAPDSPISCTEEYQPVVCNGCTYDNMCYARAARQRLKKCQRTCKGSSECSEKEVCLRDFKTCRGTDCVGTCVKKTGNTCDGFIGTTCPMGEKCVVTPCPPGVMDSCGGHCVDDGCRKPSRGSNEKCGNDFNPVTCGDGCQYKNQCLANQAGYSEDQCKGFCPLPNPMILCPAVQPMYVCGESQCEYSRCHLESSGFSMDQCKPDCKHTACPAIACANPVYVEGECCPTCKDIKPRDCSMIPCRYAVCANGEKPEVPEGECCPVCKKDCSDEFCPVPKCTHGYRPERKEGECCPVCVPDPCRIPDCKSNCATLKCGPGEEPFKPYGHCCATTCVRRAVCRMRCPQIRCWDDEELFREAGECCPKCRKRCSKM